MLRRAELSDDCTCDCSGILTFELALAVEQSETAISMAIRILRALSTARHEMIGGGENMPYSGYTDTEFRMRSV